MWQRTMVLTDLLKVKLKFPAGGLKEKKAVGSGGGA